LTPSDPIQWQRVEAIFFAALDVPPDARDRWLADHCADEPHLVSQVQALLQADARGDGQIERAVGEAMRTLTPVEPGVRLGAYMLVREIGRGGMGTVFQAIRADGEFHQTVAIKVIKRGLDTDAILRRFRQERHILARLDHPGIARLLDAGTSPDDRPYLVMEFVDGVPLADYQATLREKLSLFTGICEAVQHSHERQVLHRDLKPGNILVTAGGQAKLLDFGIAKWLDPELAPETAPETEYGHSPLTPDYASPEQLRHEPLTERTDVWALGVILREFTAGESALPGALRRIIRQATEPEPRHRYASAAALGLDLRRYLDGERVSARRWRIGRRTWLIAAAFTVIAGIGLWWTLARRQTAGSLDSLAVLPFVGLGASAADESLADGLTAELIQQLGAVPRLKVPGRTASWQYRGRVFDPREAGRALGVAAVLEGSVREWGGQVRIVVQLIAVRDGFHLWAGSYNRTGGNALRTQDEVARLIVDELRSRLAAGWNERGRSQPNGEAERAFLEGYQLFHAKSINEEWTGGIPPRLEASIAAFERAIQLDPEFAAAWAGLAEVSDWAVDLDESRRSAFRQRAEAAARRALDLEPTNALALLTLGNAYFAHDRNLRRAEPYLRRAVELSPRSTGMHSDYADLLFALGRHEEALSVLRRIQILEPGSPRPSGRIAVLAAMLGRHDEARAAARAALGRDPQYRHALWAAAFLSEREGAAVQAIEGYRKLLTLHPSDDRALASLGSLLARQGAKAEARGIAARLRSMTERGRRREVFEALVLASLGESAAALTLLEKAWERHDPNLINLELDPRFRSLSSEPRYQAILRRLAGLR
jgi:serine/threonine protein kinase/tetratricopeptide (TPR) repeat protein